MTNPVIDQNLITTEPSLKDLLDLFQKDILLSLNCHHIGTVNSFDSTKQLARVTINYTQTYFEFDEDTGVTTPVPKNFPVIIDAPVICLGGGTGSLTFPIAEGDECLVLFNDRSIDNWFSGGNGSAVSSSRLHSFSDAIILVGVRSLSKVLSGYNTSGTELKYGTTKLILTSKIALLNNSQNLGTLIQNLITQLEALGTQLQAFTTATANITFTSGSDPNPQAATISSIGSQIGSIGSQISAIKTNFGALLT